METVLLADSSHIDCSSFLKLKIGIPSDSDIMRIEIEGKQWLISFLFD